MTRPRTYRRSHPAPRPAKGCPCGASCCPRPDVLSRAEHEHQQGRFIDDDGERAEAFHVRVCRACGAWCSHEL